MIEFLSDYGLFLAKSVTIVLAVIAVVGGIVAIAARGRKDAHHGSIDVTHLNEELEEMKHSLEASILDEGELKAQLKEEKKKEKADKKAEKQARKTGKVTEESRKRIYVLDFDGDIRASDVEPLREEISAILTLAEPEDEVVLRLESGGGMVHSYGLASSQLERLKRKNIPLTVCVDQVAASGGYMMACLGDRVLAAPFAILGSIGVIAQLPNFHRLLEKHDIDYEVLTAGEYKRTLTMFGQNTDKGRQKFMEELEDTHVLFKEYVSEYRPQLDIDKVATGEVWFGKRAIDARLVDELITSDEYLTEACAEADVYIVRYEEKKTLQDKLSAFAVESGDGILSKWYSRLVKNRFISF
ncbi:MAG: protease SohB [Pontibacterium sp.]